MITKEELVNKLKSLNKYDDDKINSIIENYEKSIKLRDSRLSRKNNYQKIKDILGVDGFGPVRFYKIRNVSACVLRDEKNSVTKVAFSFYNLNDLASKCTELDEKKDKLGQFNWESNMVPFLYQISPSRYLDECIHASENLRDNKFSTELPGIRASELAVYEAWTKLSRDKIIPRQYRKWRLEARIALVKIGDMNILTPEED